MQVNNRFLEAVLPNYNFYFQCNNHGYDYYCSSACILTKESVISDHVMYIAKLDEINIDFDKLYYNNIIFISDKKEVINSINLTKNMVLIVTQDDIMHVFELIHGIIDEYMLWSDNLLDVLVKENNLDQLVEAGYNKIQKPFNIIDLTERILAYTKNDGCTLQKWNDSKKYGYTYSDSDISIMLKKIYKAIEKKEPAILFIDELKKRTMCIPILNHGFMCGKLVILEYDDVFTYADILIAQYFASIASIQLSRSQAEYYNKDNAYSEIMNELLSDDTRYDAAMLKRLAILGWDNNKKLYLLMICSLDIKYPKSMMVKVQDYLEKLNILPKCIWTIYQNNLIMIFDSGKEIIDNMNKELEFFLKEKNLYAGLSREFNSLKHIRDQIKYAADAIRLGRTKNKSQRFFQYDNYKIHRLREIVGENEDYEIFYYKPLINLIEYDIENGTEYSKTLKYYMQTGLNSMETASSMYVHRNTITYRIKKSEEIMNATLKNGDTIFQIQLTFKLMDDQQK